MAAERTDPERHRQSRVSCTPNGHEPNTNLPTVFAARVRDRQRHEHMGRERNLPQQHVHSLWTGARDVVLGHRRLGGYRLRRRRRAPRWPRHTPTQAWWHTMEYLPRECYPCVPNGVADNAPHMAVPAGRGAGGTDPPYTTHHLGTARCDAAA